MTIKCRFNVVRPSFVLDVDLSLPSKGVSAIFGSSGSGKTTLLRAIAGLEKNKGQLKVGNDIWQDDSHFVPTHERSIGYVFQEASLFEHLNVKGNIEYGFKRSNCNDRSIMHRAIQMLEIEHLLERRVDQLSGGERQRVAIVRALSLDPKMLLMDEPLASLGENHKKEILPFLELLHEELDIPMIYVTHSIDEVARLADHLILLDGGKVIGDGEITEMLTQLDCSLAHGERAVSLIHAMVSEHDENFHLTTIKFSGGSLSMPKKQLPVGSKVRLRIEARDVSLALGHQDDTSILNILPCTVDNVVDEGDAQVMVRLKVGEDLMLSCITKKSAELLKLQTGKSVYAQIKSVALL